MGETSIVDYYIFVDAICFREKIPVAKSRGVVWDMHQYYVLFNSTRVPALPKDRMDRYFRTGNMNII